MFCKENVKNFHFSLIINTFVLNNQSMGMLHKQNNGAWHANSHDFLTRSMLDFVDV